MKFKLDENIGLRGLRILTVAGHDVATVHGQSLDGAEDRKLIDVCKEEQRALVTLDLDFANPLVFEPHRYPASARRRNRRCSLHRR
jgi:predicted nuclease of predicted toxin-antitoxin system